MSFILWDQQCLQMKHIPIDVRLGVIIYTFLPSDYIAH